MGCPSSTWPAPSASTGLVPLRNLQTRMEHHHEDHSPPHHRRRRRGRARLRRRRPASCSPPSRPGPGPTRTPSSPNWSAGTTPRGPPSSTWRAASAARPRATTTSAPRSAAGWGFTTTTSAMRPGPGCSRIGASMPRCARSAKATSATRPNVSRPKACPPPSVKPAMRRKLGFDRPADDDEDLGDDE